MAGTEIKGKGLRLERSSLTEENSNEERFARQVAIIAIVVVLAIVILVYQLKH